MKFADQLHVARVLASALRSQWWSAERIARHQEDALVRMMRHALLNVPYYRRLGLRADAIESAQDLRRFPLLTKRDVQRDPDAFLAEGFDRASLFASRTSGSSGQPTTTWFDREAWLAGKYALKIRRVLATSDTPLPRRVAIVSEQAPERLEALRRAAPGLGMLYRALYLSIHEPAEHHLERLRRFAPRVLYAFPSYLLDLVASAERNGVPLPRIPVLSTSSEVLAAPARVRIESAFGGRLHDVYGSTEFKEVAWQCRAGRYHLNFETVYLERPSQGAAGPVILSTLSNRAMPLLRFDIGDRATFVEGRCECGRQSAQLAAIEGREGEMMTLPSGRRLSPYVLTTAVESEDAVLQYQIVQLAPTALRVDFVRRPGAPSEGLERRVRAAFCAVLAEPLEVELREVERLGRTAGGKRSVFVRAAA